VERLLAVIFVPAPQATAQAREHGFEGVRSKRVPERVAAVLVLQDARTARAPARAARTLVDGVVLREVLRRL
jgi:hypothetical protein